MNLHFTLPKAEQALLGECDVQYCAPYDLTIAGDYTETGWLAVTRERIVVFLNGEILHDYNISDLSEIKAEAGVGCGLLYVALSPSCSSDASIGAIEPSNGEKVVLFRYGMRHLSRFAFIARGANVFRNGGTHLIQSTEIEMTCSTCGQNLRGAKHCPKCEGRSHTWKRLGGLLKPQLPRIVFISFLLLLSAGLMIWQQDFFRRFIDNYLQHDHTETGMTGSGRNALIAFILVISSIAFFNIFSMWIRFRSTVKLGAELTAGLRHSLYHKIQELSLSFIDKSKSGELINRISHDTNHVQSFVSNNVAFLFSNIVTMVGAVIVMFVIHWQFTLVVLALVPVIVVMNRIFWRFVMRIFRMQWRRFDAISSRLQDVISGIRVVKAYGREEAEAERFNELTGRFADVVCRNEKFFATFFPVLMLLMNLSASIVVFFGGRLVLNDTMTMGQLVQFIAYTNMLFGPLGWMSFLPRDIMNLMTCMERIGDVLDEEPEQVDVENALDVRIKGAVTLDNITFGYKSYEPVLENVSVEVAEGEYIGIVGPSGAGKSTLINILMRLYDVDEGQVLIDGVDIRQYKQESYHNQLGVVLQEPFLFAGSIYANIRFSRPTASEEEVIMAAKMANAHDFICKTPDGYNTRVGENGLMLSGGERQRLSIARAILNDPVILILDEATSSLDSESEFQIQEALTRLTKGRTTFSIAHRLSTLRNADRIMVIDKHTLLELGTHDELIRQKGIYYNLVMAQLQTHKVKT